VLAKRINLIVGLSGNVAGTVCIWWLSGKTCRHRLNDRTLGNSLAATAWPLLCARRPQAAANGTKQPVNPRPIHGKPEKLTMNQWQLGKTMEFGSCSM
jgi:hypothetical protein